MAVLTKLATLSISAPEVPAPNDSSTSPSNRILPTLFTLPPELKASIVEFVDEIDEEERIMLDDGEFEDIDEETLDGMISVEEVEHHDPVEGEGSIASSEEEVKIRSICNLSLVDVEFSKLSFPFIWSHIDFQGRDNLSVKFFVDEILPRHAQHIESIWFRTSREENNVYNDYDSDDEDAEEEEEMEGDVVNHVGDMSAGFPAGEDISVTSIRAMGRTTWDEHVRINLFTEIIKFLPNLSTADLDVMSDQVISVKLLHALLQKPIIDLSVNGPEGERIQPIMLATMVHALPGLVRLAIDGADEALDCFSDEEHLPYVISHLEHLETLFLSDAYFVDKTFANQDWKGKLSVLALDECDFLPFPDFISFIHKFRDSLLVLDLDNVPTVFSETDNAKCLKKSYDLPKLSALVVSGYHPISFLDAFNSSPLETIELGFCPSITCDEIEKLLLFHFSKAKGQPGLLKKFVILGNSHLSDGQKDGLEVWCFAKGIECRVETADSDEDDNSDDDNDNDDQYYSHDEDDDWDSDPDSDEST